MYSVKNLALGALISAVSVLPVSAGPLTWTFGGTGNIGLGTGNGIQWYDSSSGVINVLSGSFDFNADAALPNQFSSVNVTVSGAGTLCSTTVCSDGNAIIPPGNVWFAQSTVDNSTGNSSQIELLNVDPTLAGNSDLSNLSGPGNIRAFAIQFVVNGTMDNSGGTFSLPAGDAGYCLDAECANVITTPAPGAPASVFLADSNASISAVASDTPEPVTFVLAGSALVGFGLVRKKRIPRG